MDDKDPIGMSDDLRSTDRAILTALSHRQGDSTPLSPDQERLLDGWVAGRLSSFDADRAAELAKHNSIRRRACSGASAYFSSQRRTGCPGHLSRAGFESLSASENGDA